MTPVESVKLVVLPTLRDFLRAATNRRIAYLSAIAAFYILDFAMQANLSPNADQKSQKVELKRVRQTIRGAGADAFDIVEGICNGAKHCGRDTGTRFTPGDEQRTKPFGFGVGCAGFSEGTFGPPRLFVMIDGRRIIVDIAVRAFLLATVDAVPQHLSAIDIDAIRD